MKTNRIVFPNAAVSSTTLLDSSLSIAPLIQHLKQVIAYPKEHKNYLAQLVLDQFELHLVTECKAATKIAEDKNLAPLFSLLYSFQNGYAEQSSYWTVVHPNMEFTLFGTDAAYTLMLSGIEENNFVGFQEWRIRCIYALILGRLYGYPKNIEQSFIYTDYSHADGFRNHYAWDFDFSYMEVQLKSDELPILDFSKIINNAHIKDIDLDSMQGFLPLSNFHFEGFAMLKAKDVTVEVEIERMKEFSHQIDAHAGKGTYDDVLKTIRHIFRKKDIQISFIPLFGDFILENLLEDDRSEKSFFFKIAQKKENANFKLYLNDPKIMVYHVMGIQTAIEPYFLSYLKASDISSYICFPLFYKGVLSGLFEVYFQNGDKLDEYVTIQLRNITDLLAQITYELSLEFNSRVNQFIMDKFTFIQPAVEWKFKEVAVKYIREKLILEIPEPIVGDIILSNVVPLYGAVDIRNSTEIRNTAIRKDLGLYLNALDLLIADLRNLFPFMENDEITNATRYWRDKLQEGSLEQVFVRLMDFCNKDVPAFLSFFKKQAPQVLPALLKFEQYVDPFVGDAYGHRRALEQAMQTQNKLIGELLDQLYLTIQNQLPCYFDKFRTDGIEYDIYLGQSISPKIQVSHKEIAYVRLEQLKTMVAIANRMYKLKDESAYPLETTYLIYVNPSNIDVSFRTDERRFDVEGAYNVRYQVIKKRIDKITIKDSYERLTQPYQIAIVYLNEEMRQEYVKLIGQLKKVYPIQGIIDYLELEDVQGISGLKAIRFNALI